MVVNKIVIFNTTPFTKRDFIRFGGEVFSKNGFDVWFFDFSPIVYPELYKNCTFPDLYQPQNYSLCSKKSEALKAIAELPLDSLVIMFPPFDRNTLIIYKALSKTKIPYCVVANQSLPVSVDQGTPKKSKFRKFLSSIKINNFKNFIYLPQMALRNGIRHPDFCIAGSEPSLEKNKTRYLIGDNTEILWAHKLDYDIFLEGKSKNLLTAGNTAVFLDPLSPMFQADTLALGFKVPTTVENYYPSICKFFDHVEKELDLKIEIAAHPKSDHPPYPEYFGGRRTIRGDTFDMIENARFVMTHSSTALQFGILLKKPIISLTTRELESDRISSGHIKAYAHSIEKKPINIDEPITIDWKKELHVDKKTYDNYIELYIKKIGTEELNTWQILSNRLKCF
jgi:hypothetical protein